MNRTVQRLRRSVPPLALLVGTMSCVADDIDPISSIAATVSVFATGCRNTAGHGIGTNIEPGVILTSAHTLAGADTITVTDVHGETTTASLLAFDPEMDLALLGTDPNPSDSRGVDVVELTDDPPTTDETPGLVGTIVVERDGDLVTMPVTIERRVIITTEDIHRDGETRRPGFELIADIEPGDSGALLVVDGRGIGVVWSRSTRTNGRAWAVDPVRGGTTIRDHMESGIPDSIDLERC